MKYIVLGLFFIVGAFFAGTGVWGIVAEIRRVARLRAWPKVMGQVLDSQVTETDGDGSSYGVRVKWQYKVMGYPPRASPSLFAFASTFTYNLKS